MQNAAAGAADDAIMLLLETALADSVYFAQAPAGAYEPCVIVSPVSDVTEYALNGRGGVYTISYLVRAIADGQQARQRASDLIAAADAALQGAALEVDGYAVLTLLRSGGGQRYADGDGSWNCSYYYQLTMYKED